MNKQQTKANFNHVIELMQNKAWKIALTGKKGEREEIACELIDSLGELAAEISNIVDDMQ